MDKKEKRASRSLNSSQKNGNFSLMNPLRLSAKSGNRRNLKTKSEETSSILDYSDDDASSSESKSSPREGWHHINLRDVELSIYQKLGRGATSCVYSGSINGFGVAIKAFHEFVFENEYLADGDDLLREVKIMETITHHRIVRCFGHKIGLLQGEKQLMLFLELCHGSLKDIIEEYRNNQKGIINGLGKEDSQPSIIFHAFPSREIVHFMTQIAEGLYHLHHELNPKVIHRDIKSDNILYVKHIDEQLPRLKIGDFGEALHNKKSKFEPNIGTLEFCAPETLSSHKKNLVQYDEKIDIWSYGMILFELLTLEIPYRQEFGRDKREIEKAIESGRRPNLNNKGSRIRERIMPILYHQCTDFNPRKRPSAQDILSKFFNSFR